MFHDHYFAKWFVVERVYNLCCSWMYWSCIALRQCLTEPRRYPVVGQMIARARAKSQSIEIWVGDSVGLAANGMVRGDFTMVMIVGGSVAALRLQRNGGGP